jgi:succinate-semialdehyde dehydrogenase/glutarate-semialdehyde dehydrogenase
MSATFAVMNPATGKSVADAPDNGPNEARAAVARAVAGFAAWRRTTAYERSTVLRAWASRILANDAELARLMAQEMGKPVTEARGEVRYAVSFVEWYAEEAKRVYGETIPSQAAHKRILVQPQPVGPVYAITPWNFLAVKSRARLRLPRRAASLKPAEHRRSLIRGGLWSTRWAANLPGVTSDPVLSAVFFDDAIGS